MSCCGMQEHMTLLWQCDAKRMHRMFLWYCDEKRGNMMFLWQYGSKAHTKERVMGHANWFVTCYYTVVGHSHTFAIELFGHPTLKG